MWGTFPEAGLPCSAEAVSPAADLESPFCLGWLWPACGHRALALPSLAFSVSVFSWRVNLFNRYSLGARFSCQGLSKLTEGLAEYPQALPRLTLGACLLQQVTYPSVTLIKLSAICPPAAPWRKRSVESSLRHINPCGASFLGGGG